MAEISVESFKRVDLITVKGRVDGSNYTELEDVFNNLSSGGRYRLVTDLSGIEIMTSAGLRALIGALRECKKHSGDLRIAAPSERMKEVLNLAGLVEVFDIYEDTTSAVGSY